jgi:hypothetical protein
MVDDTARAIAARTWYRNLLTRELADRDAAVAAADLDDKMLLRKADQLGSPLSMTLLARVGDYQRRINAQTGETLGWYFDAFAQVAGTDILAEEALKKAGEEVVDLPTDAELDVAELELDGPRPIYRMRWIHRLDGVLIEEDYIEVLVNATNARVFAFNRSWRDPRLNVEAEIR